MAVLRWDPWGELAALQRDVDRLIGGRENAARAGSLIPPMDAYRTEEGMVVRLELPGMRPEDVDVSVNDGVLTVAGERKVEAGISEEQWIRRERRTGRFERSFSLPEGTDPGGIRASFDHGLLELVVPHPPERRPHRIEVGQKGSGEQLQVEAAQGRDSS